MLSAGQGHLQGARCLGRQVSVNRCSPAEASVIHGILDACLQTMVGFPSVQPGKEKKGRIVISSPRGQTSELSRAFIKSPICQTARVKQWHRAEGERRKKGRLTDTGLEIKTTPATGPAGPPHLPPGPVSPVNRSRVGGLGGQPVRGHLEGRGCLAWYQLRCEGEKPVVIVH